LSTRSLRTLLLTDLVGSTALIDAAGDRRGAQIGAKFDRLSRDLLVTHGGTEIDKTDGFLLIFESPDHAVRYALAMHEALAELSREEDLPIVARCGIHLGEVHLRENTPEDVARGAKPVEVEGLAKPLAARVMSLAQGGQTLLSRTAWDVAKRAAVGEPDLADCVWLQHGIYDLKGVSEGVEICEVGRKGIAPLKAPPSAEKARRRGERRALPWLVGALAAVAVMGALGLWATRTVETVKYYGEVIAVHGALEGRWALDEAQIDPLQQTYAVTEVNGRATDIRVISHPTVRIPFFPEIRHLRQHWEGDRVVRVDHLNGRDQLVDYADLEHVEGGYHYRMREPDGATSSRVRVDRYLGSHLFYGTDARGYKVRRTFMASHSSDRTAAPDTVWEVDDIGRRLREEYRDADGNPVAGSSGFVAMEYAYDASKHPWNGVSQRFEGFGGVPLRGPHGWDDRGRLDTQTCLDGNGARTPDMNGCVTISAHYEDGEVNVCMDSEGEPIVRHDLDFSTRIRLDEDGAVLRKIHLDAAGAPSVDANGVAVQELRYEDFAFQVGEARVDSDGERKWSDDTGYGWSATYDDRGNRTALTWLDGSGNPGIGPHGHVAARLTFDGANRPTSLRFYDADNQPVASSLPRDLLPSWMKRVRGIRDDYSGFHAHLITYDPDSGAPSEERFLDSFEEPLAVDGVASRKLEFDEFGRLSRRMNFDADGEPTLGRVAGYISKDWWCYGSKWERDAADRLSRLTCLDDEGEPTPSQLGHATVENRYGGLGDDPTEVRFLDAAGELATAHMGFAIHRRGYDAAQNRIRDTFFDKGNKRVLSQRDGCWRRQHEYDQAGRIVNNCCYGVHDEPLVSRVTGAHCRTKKWSDVAPQKFAHLERLRHGQKRSPGEIVEEAHFGVDGEPIVSRGYHRVHITFEDGYRKVHFLGTEGEPVLTPGGFAMQATRKDTRGDIVEIRVFGLDGEPVDAPAFCASMFYDYDPLGRHTATRNVSASGDPCAIPGQAPPELRFAYDSRGNKIRTDNYDGRGAPLLFKGFASVLLEFDDFRNETSRRYLGVRGEAIAVQGCHDLQHGYDRERRVTRLACLDTRGGLAIGPTGAAETLTTWGANNSEEPLRVESRGVAGELVVDESGCAILERTFDRIGHKTSELCRGADAELTLREGSAGGRWTYNSAGAETRFERLGVDGELLSTGGFARRDTVRGPFRNALEIAWFDAGGQPIEGPEGCERRVRSYTPSGAVLADACDP